MQNQRYLQVVVQQGDINGSAKTESLFMQFLINLNKIVKDKPISLELLGFEQYTYFYVVLPSGLVETVQSILYSIYPDCEIREVEDYTRRMPTGAHVAGAALSLKFSDIYSVKTFDEFENDSQSQLFSVFSKIKSGEQAWVQIVISAKVKNMWYHIERSLRIKLANLGNMFRIKDRFRKEEGDGTLAKVRRKIMNEKLKIEPFEAVVRAAYVAADSHSAREKIHAVMNSFFVFNRTDVGEFRMRTLASESILSQYRNRSLLGSKVLSAKEIATFYHLPNADHVPHIVHMQAKKSEPPQDLPKEKTPLISFFGMTNYHNNHIPFGIRREDRRRHLYAVGKSGSGKSKLLELLIREDILSGQGVCVLDPHGDLVDNILRVVPKERINDVILFDPSDVDFPISFNPMEVLDPALKMQVTIGFISIFKKLFGSNWTDRLEHVLRYTILALLDSKNTTVLSILKMLTDKNYRQKIVARIEDSVVKNFWVSEFASWSEKFDAEAITPLLNKVGQFVATDMMRNIVGQPQNKFNIRDVMDQRKILLMKVSKGLLGEENSGLIGSMIVTKIYEAAMQRADVREEDRTDFYFYVDEFQNFATTTFAEILSEARKYRLNLTIAHQYMGQLSETITKTVFGNVGSMISFRVGAEDAKVLAQEYNPIFSERDIINLGVREFYIKMSINGELREAFSGRTLSVEREANDYTKEIIEMSRQKYCAPREAVKKLLSKWDESGDFGANNTVGSGTVDFEAPII